MLPTSEKHAAQLALIQKQIEADVRDAFDYFVQNLKGGMNPRLAFHYAMTQFTSKFKDAIAEGLGAMLKKSIGDDTLKELKIGDIALSEKLYANRKAVETATMQVINDHAKGMQEFNKLSMRIYDGYNPNPGGDPLQVKAKLPKYLSKVIQGEPGLRLEMNKLLAQMQVAKIKTDGLRAAYKNAIAALEQGAATDVLVKKLQHAFFERNRFFANRIAQTELHRAYTDSLATEIMARTDIHAVQIKMSVRHPKLDICDFHSGADLYGLGAGVYPKALAPKPPFHPFCMCIIQSRLDIEAGQVAKKGKAINGAANAFLTAKDPWVAQQIVGSKAKLARVLSGKESIYQVVDKGKPMIYRTQRLNQFVKAPLIEAAIATDVPVVQALPPDQGAPLLPPKPTEKTVEQLTAEVKAAHLAEVKSKGDALLSRATAKAQANFDALQKKANTQYFFDAKDGKFGAYLKKAAKIHWDLNPWIPDPETLQAMAKDLQYKQQLKLNSAKFSNAVANGKQPTAAIKKWFGTLTGDDQVALLKKTQEMVALKAEQAGKLAAEQASQKIAEAEKKAMLDASKWKKVGAQKGSNPGGLFEDENGVKWYIKTPQTEAIAHNEVLASKLYAMAGVDVPELTLVMKDGKLSVASRFVDGLESMTPAKLAKLKGAHENFVVDAWLSNWDVAGQGFDNLLALNGKAFRVDVGGSLAYRAQGAAKGAAFGNAVGELQSLLDDATNPQTAKLFKGITDASLIAGAKKVAAMTDEQIRKLVAQYSGLSSVEQKTLAETLINRRNAIALKFNLTTVAETTAAKNELNLDRIIAARSNGLQIPSDKGMIEDQGILYYVDYDENGKQILNAYFKVRDAGEQAILKSLTESGVFSAQKQQANVFALDAMNDAIVTAIKGVVSSQASGNGLRAIDIQRMKAAKAEFERVYAKALDLNINGQLDDAFVRNLLDRTAPFLNQFEQLLKLKEGAAYAWQDIGFFKALEATPLIVKLPPGSADKLFWKKVSTVGYEEKAIEKGFSKAIQNPDHWNFKEGYVLQIEDTKLQYIPMRPGQNAAVGNLVHIRTEVSDQAFNKIAAAMKRLNIDLAAPTALDIEELYLRQIAYARRDGFLDFERLANKVQDQVARIKEMKAYLSLSIGTDIEKLPAYNPAGNYRAYGDGRIVKFRPELQGDSTFETFVQSYGLHHHVTGGYSVAEAVDKILNSGGMLSSTTERARRGIVVTGMSSHEDITTGGADYAFFRIKPNDELKGTTGFYFDARNLSRVDAISYSGDRYGRTITDSGDNYVLNNRNSTVSEWRSAARSGSNETILKGGISLFDGLQGIVVSNDAERLRVIAAFKKHGVEVMPDGRRVEDIIFIKRN
jgi:hypothetical protein